MEAIQNNADRLVIVALNDFPGISVVVDVTSPRQSLESNTQTPCACPLSQFVKVVGSAVDPAERDGRNIAANEQQIGTQLLHQVELLFNSTKRLLALRFGHSLKIAKRLERADFEAKITAHSGNVARRPVETREVRFEDFDCIKTSCRDGPEF